MEADRQQHQQPVSIALLRHLVPSSSWKYQVSSSFSALRDLVLPYILGNLDFTPGGSFPRPLKDDCLLDSKLWHE
eukprot:1859229-Amphidinium_carterae.1